MKTQTVRKKARRAGSAAAETAGEAARDSWHATLIALTTAEQEVEKQIRELLKRNHITRKDAARILRELGSRAVSSLNIPSRREVMDLTKKVDQLGAKIDSFRKRAVRRVRG